MAIAKTAPGSEDQPTTSRECDGLGRPSYTGHPKTSDASVGVSGDVGSPAHNQAVNLLGLSTARTVCVDAEMAIDVISAYRLSLQRASSTVREHLGPMRVPVGDRSLSVRVLLLNLVLVCQAGLLCGCVSSKWAMDDPDYAAKYSKPYGDNQPLRIVKQMFDARHVERKSGMSIGGGGGGAPSTGGVTISGFCYPNYWTEIDYGLTGLVGTGAQDWFIGPELGVRFQTPTRIAPFAGAGVFVGGNRYSRPAENDGRDNNDDGFVDEFGERKTLYKAFAAVYPEVGVHAWLTGKARLTASARYYVTEEGRRDDFWYLGLSFGWVFGADDGTADGWLSSDDDE